MKKIITFIFCTVTILSIYPEKVDFNQKKSKWSARKKIATGIGISIINLVPAYEHFQKFRYSLLCLLCSNNRICAAKYLNPLSANYVMLSNNEYPGIIELTAWPTGMIFHILCSTTGLELIEEGVADLDEIRQSNKIHPS